MNVTSWLFVVRALAAQIQKWEDICCIAVECIWMHWLSLAFLLEFHSQFGISSLGLMCHALFIKRISHITRTYIRIEVEQKNCSQWKPRRLCCKHFFFELDYIAEQLFWDINPTCCMTSSRRYTPKQNDQHKLIEITCRFGIWKQICRLTARITGLENGNFFISLPGFLCLGPMLEMSLCLPFFLWDLDLWHHLSGGSASHGSAVRYNPASMEGTDKTADM